MKIKELNTSTLAVIWTIIIIIAFVIIVILAEHAPVVLGFIGVGIGSIMILGVVYGMTYLVVDEFR